HFLKGEDTGWRKQPRVLLQVRHPGERFVEHAEREWPLARTRWTKFYLDPADHRLTPSAGVRAGRVSYAGLGYGVTFLTAPLTPGRVYDLDVEIWPTSIVVPAGHRIGLTVRGRDYEFPGGPAVGLGTLGAVFTGVGPFKHDDAADRPPEVFGKSVTIHCGP